MAELSGGFHGSLANSEVTFMVLEGTMVILAVILLTVCHPGFSFGGAWQQANFTLKKAKPAEFTEDKDVPMTA